MEDRPPNSGGQGRGGGSGKTAHILDVSHEDINGDFRMPSRRITRQRDIQQEGTSGELQVIWHS